MGVCPARRPNELLEPRGVVDQHRLRIFHPRQQAFRDHFAVRKNGLIVGRTAVGRATVAMLAMNREIAVQLRIEEMSKGRYP